MGATGLSETELEADLAHWVESAAKRWGARKKSTWNSQEVAIVRGSTVLIYLRPCVYRQVVKENVGHVF